MLGRPGILRVYVPVLSLLLVAPVIMWEVSNRARSGLRWGIALSALLIAALANTSAAFFEASALEDRSARVRESLRDFPREPVLIWGGVFPYEAVYPVLGQTEPGTNFQFYALGVFALAPFSVIVADDYYAEGFLDHFVSERGIPVVADNLRYELLRTYCAERLNGNLENLSDTRFGDVSVGRRRCNIEPKQPVVE